MYNLFESAKNSHFKKFKVSDLLFTEYTCLEDRGVFDVWSHYNYFVYVLSGKKQWDTQQASYIVYTGELIFVKKGANIIHKFFEEEFCALLIFMPDSYIKNIIQSHSQHNISTPAHSTESVLPIPVDNTLQAYFQSLYAYFCEPETPPNALLEVKFQELLLNLVSSNKFDALQAYFHSISHFAKPYIPTIMDANFTYDLTLEDYARMCGRSLSTFKRDFKAIYHCPPGKWLTQKRLEYARNQLMKADRPISEILFECGFKNASHFTKAFKKHFGMTPIEYIQ